MMKLICVDRRGRQEIKADSEFLRSTFSGRQLLRLNAGKLVHKGSVEKRRAYWRAQQQQVRSRLQAHTPP